jgi:hypothetical protein
MDVLSGPLVLDQDFYVTLDDFGVWTFPMGTALPAVADIKAEGRILLLEADLEHVVLQGPQIRKIKSSLWTSLESDFLVAKDGVQQIPDTDAFPKEVRMASGPVYMVLKNRKVVAIKCTPISRSVLPDGHAAQTLDSALAVISDDETIVSDGTSNNIEVSQLPESHPDTAATEPASSPDPDPLSTLVSQSESNKASTSSSTSTLRPKQSISVNHSACVHHFSVAPWLKHLEENYEELFLSILTPQIRLALAKDEKLQHARWNCTILDELQALAYSLAGSHRPSRKEFDHLAYILAKKHPRNFGTVDVATFSSGRGTLKHERHRRQEWKYKLRQAHQRPVLRSLHEKKNAVARSKEAVTEEEDGETPKKAPKGRGGRLKRMDGMDTQKMFQKLTTEEKAEKTTMLQTAENQNLEERTEVYKFDAGESLVQEEMIYASVSAAKAMAPSFFQSTIHLQNLFFAISHSQNIFEKCRQHFQEEIRVLEEFLLDELPPGSKTSLIRSITEKKDNPSQHAFFTLRLLAELWEQNIDQLIFVNEKDNECLKNCPEPHLVAALGDLNNLALYVDHTKIWDCLDVQTGLAALIAVHFLANLKYGTESLLLKEYVQREVLELGLQFELQDGTAKVVFIPNKETRHCEEDV